MTGAAAMWVRRARSGIKMDPRPEGIMMEYYRNPEKTDDAIYDGWYHTGDMCWSDEDGFFWYVGRNDDVIKSSGYRIGPFEIESVLLEHDAVRECAVTACLTPYVARPSRRPSCLPTATRHPMRSPRSCSVGSSAVPRRTSSRVSLPMSTSFPRRSMARSAVPRFATTTRTRTRTVWSDGRLPSALEAALAPITIIAGHYGAGKTNLSVNLALDLVRDRRAVTLVDLDIVNPYFRASEQRGLLEQAGVHLVAPVFSEAGTSLDVPSLTGRHHARARGCG